MTSSRDLPDKDIQARKALLYGDDTAAPAGPRKAFADRLRDTPPAPLGPGVKAALWAAGVAVASLFALSLVKGLGPKPRPTPPPATSAVAGAPAPRS